MVQQPLTHLRQIGCSVRYLPRCQLNLRIQKTLVATDKTGHLQQAPGPLLREFATLRRHRLREGERMGKTQPADTVVDRAVKRLLVGGVKADLVPRIGLLQRINQDGDTVCLQMRGHPGQGATDSSLL